jgi:HAD superfamily hydrolase (TIGR01484 family)
MKYIYSDFDGTLTTQNGLSAIFFDILTLIEDKGAELIVVSGRSLSWGHFLLTHFNLNTVIMEGGGVIIRKDSKGSISEELLVKDQTVIDLAKLESELSKAIPKCLHSADSFGRKTDRAIEFKHIDDVSVEEITNFLDLHKVNYSFSNVHLNYWLEDISKFNAVKHHMSLNNVEMSQSIFFGDALNDQSMFEHFEHTVGVSNIARYLDQMDHKPKVVLTGDENRGAAGVLNYLKANFL